MILNVLALIDRFDRDDCVKTAAYVAMAAGAGLVLAIDPQDAPFMRLDAEMNHLVDAALAAGVPTSTMLIDLADVDAVLCAVRNHRIDVVVLPGMDEATAAMRAITSALFDAGIATVPVATYPAVPA